MSIWTELLLFHGHVATPAALALFAPAGTRRHAGSASPADAGAAADRTPPETPTAPPAPRAAGSAGEPHHHALRTVGQLR